MKKAIFTFAMALASIVSYGQKFFTADAQLVPSSIYAYTHRVADSTVVDSTRFEINCWFGQVNNPYVDTVSHAWCQFSQITRTVKGNAKSSYYLNISKKFCEAYRKQKYPNIGQ